MKFAPLTENEVLSVLNKLKNKSCKLDTVPIKILKQLLLTILSLITKIINLSLGNGDFCRSWKVVVVRLLLKKLGLHLIHSNFRPASNLPFVSKVVERCMLMQVNHHCDSYILQPDYQSAYREHYSCETVVLELSDKILWSI